MRPDYLSFDEYGTVHLAFVLMYVNNVRFIEEFQGLDIVIIPSYSSIIEMLKDKFPIQKTEDLTEVNW
jgi:plasmid replication initiation protein